MDEALQEFLERETGFELATLSLEKGKKAPKDQ